MTMEQVKVRHNYVAIVIAAVACFTLEAVWYTIFLQAWLDGIGRTREAMMHSGVSTWMQYAVALVSAMIVAVTISTVTQLTGDQTAVRGMKVGALLWLGIVFTTWATEYIFEARSFKLLGINTGVWLIGMTMMGAVVGTWKKKVK
jgi:hypothetical protein